MAFPSQSKSSMFGKTEYYQCQYGDGGIQEFKLEIPPFFKPNKPIFYYDKAGSWIENPNPYLHETEVYDDKIVFYGWKSDECDLRKVLSRLKDENNKVFLHNYYEYTCGSYKKDELFFRQDCKFYEK